MGQVTARSAYITVDLPFPCTDCSVLGRAFVGTSARDGRVATLRRAHHLDRPLACGLHVEGLRVPWRYARDLCATRSRRGDVVREVAPESVRVSCRNGEVGRASYAGIHVVG